MSERNYFMEEWRKIDEPLLEMRRREIQRLEERFASGELDHEKDFFFSIALENLKKKLKYEEEWSIKSANLQYNIVCAHYRLAELQCKKLGFKKHV